MNELTQSEGCAINGGMVKLITKKAMSPEELIGNSTVVKPVNIVKDRNNCLGGWNEELESACQESKGRIRESFEEKSKKQIADAERRREHI